MTDTTFVQRYIKIIIGIGSGVLGDETPVIYTLDNHRASVEIVNYGGESQGEARVKIFGMSLSLMNKLTTIGPVMSQLWASNTIEILAGTNPDALTSVYIGSILTAMVDLNAAPDASFEVFAFSSAVAALQSADSTVFSKAVSIDTVMRKLANNLSLAYLNTGKKTVEGVEVADPVTGSFTQPVTFNGSYLDQIKSCASSVMPARIDFKIENGTLYIKNPFSHYQSANVPVISPTTGMTGYPVFNSHGATLKSLFLPFVVLGGEVQVKDSQIDAVNKFWTVFYVRHELESLTPHGRWFTLIGAFPSDTNT